MILILLLFRRIFTNYSAADIYGAQSTVVTKSTFNTKEFRGLAKAVIQSDTSSAPSCALTDEDASEILFDVDAPKGELGIAIDSTESGPPLVHAVKELSVMKGKILVGDRIVYCDDIDTAELSSVELMRLIGSKEEQPRKFGVIRRVSYETSPNISDLSV